MEGRPPSVFNSVMQHFKFMVDNRKKTSYDIIEWSHSHPWTSANCYLKITVKIQSITLRKANVYHYYLAKHRGKNRNR